MLLENCIYADGYVVYTGIDTDIPFQILTPIQHNAELDDFEYYVSHTLDYNDIYPDRHYNVREYKLSNNKLTMVKVSMLKGEDIIEIVYNDIDIGEGTFWLVSDRTYIGKSLYQ